ncbi:peptidylprolyl isomerase [Phenylobacterium sp.]|uniref:peptidylprolyl isomerase n=1 Tax=Phenylobacterium sp. TaxID=1871053 RepID=UPI0027363050|nr:peptidylprolyl isomerase [Phenylobacterium sp.]MDP3658433.1 peptidylprolyl isomerase [Phenylobacterium sp.]
MTRVRIVGGRAMRGWTLAAALLASAAPGVVVAQAAAPAKAPAPSALSESVAAVVNDDIISTYDLGQRMRLLIVSSGVQPTAESLPQLQQEALVSLVDQHLQLQELRRVERDQKISLIATDEELELELADLAKQNNTSKEQFLAALAARGVSAETLRGQLRAQVSWQRWIRGRYGTRLRIGDDQIKAAQQRIVAAASKPQYQISEVLIDASRVGGMDAAMSGGAQLVSELQKGAPFPAVARQFSAAPSAAAGGDAGWVSQGELAPEVQAALDQMRPGQLSQPIPVRDGVYLVFLRDKRAGSGGTLVNMKQAAVALGAQASAGDLEAARVKLERVRTATTSCADLEAAAAKVPGVVAGDLGEAEVADLAPQFRDAAQTLPTGQLSQPIRTNAGLHLVVVCGKRASGVEDADRAQIENRLFGQQLSMISRRYMRDLRNSATIETR